MTMLLGGWHDVRPIPRNTTS